MVKKKLEREEEEEEAVTSCDVHDVFQVLLLLLQLINCGDGGTKRLPFAEAYKIPLYLLQRVGEGRGRVGSADWNDKQHVFTFWGRQWQSMVMFMPTLSWGNRAAAEGRGVQGGRGEEDSRVASLPQIAFNYVACCSRFYGPLLTCLQSRVAACVARVLACGMFVLMIWAGSDQRIYLWQLLQLQLRSAFSTSAATHCHASPPPLSLSFLLLLFSLLFVFMTLILIIDSSIKMFHYARRAAQEPAANCLRKCATPPSLHLPPSPVLAISSAACEFAAFKNKLKRELCQTCWEGKGGRKGGTWHREAGWTQPDLLLNLNLRPDLCSCYLLASITELSNLPQRQLDATDCWLSDASQPRRRRRRRLRRLSLPLWVCQVAQADADSDAPIELEHLLTARAVLWADQNSPPLLLSPSLSLPRHIS